MELSDFADGQIWCMTREALELLDINFHAFTQSKDMAIEAARFTLPSRTDPDEKPYTIRDGVAVISVAGTITKKDSFYSWLFGGASVPRMIEAIRAASGDGAARAVLLSLDSPGGTIFGLDSVAEAIHLCRERKPVLAYAEGMMASAAYWIGSAAQKIIAEKTSPVGSIGVLMIHYDYSEQDRQYGLKRTYLAAGKYKALGNDAEPLSSEARTMYDAQLGHYYKLFIETVAKNRGVDPLMVLEKMADGRLFIGSQALEAGLIDKIGNLQAAVDMALGMVGDGKTQQKSFSAGGDSPGKEFVMAGEDKNVPQTVVQLAAAYPALVEAIRKEGKDSVDLGAARTEAGKVERDRILGLVAIQFGAEAGEKFKAIVEAGVTVEQFKAIQAVNPPAAEADPDKGKRDEMLGAIKGAGAANPGAGKAKVPAGEKDFMALVAEYVAVNKTTKTVAMQAVMKEHPEAHRAYIARCNA